MKHIFIFFLLGQSLLHSAEPTDAEYIKQGKTVAQAAFKELSGQLMQAMAKGGPTNAIEFCSVEALPLTKKVATQHGVAIRRVSHKPRNPVNAANKQELEQLETFEKSIAAKHSPVPAVHPNSRGVTTFYAPITINNPLCLQCHGDPSKEIGKDVLNLIKKKYPADKATGFALNELRGMWVIEFVDPGTP